eukprot:403332010
MMAFSYLVWFSYLVKKMVTSPTSNFQSLTMTAHIVTILSSCVFSLAIFLTFGFGLSSTLTCGISMSKEKSYGDFVRCWPIFLLPICIYHFVFLQREVPSLIRSSYSVFVIFFAAYVITRTILIIIFNVYPDYSYHDLSHLAVYVDMRAAVVCLKQLQVSCLIVMTALSTEKIKKVRQCFKKTRTRNQDKDLLRNDEDEDSFESESAFSDFSNPQNQDGTNTVKTQRTRGSSKKINYQISDEEFKANYSPVILQKQSTLVLKTSFHLINYILMGMCQTFKNIQASVTKENLLEDMESNTKQYIQEIKEHKINTRDFMENYQNICIYDVDHNGNNNLEILEFAPEIFKAIRAKCGVSEDLLFNSFAPIYNIQAIHNFFTGTGKSQSFFFFSDNKMFVLKTLKESEKRLLLDQGILENYFHHMMGSQESLLSKFYGVFQIRVKYMQEITCFIMDNLLGQDFINIERIYDLKGSKKGRIVSLSEEEQQKSSGLKVLKDLNLLEIGEKLNIRKQAKSTLLETMEKDLAFLRVNKLMDYSLLLIKVKIPKINDPHIKRMPAIIYVKQKDGNNRLQLKQIDDRAIVKQKTKKQAQISFTPSNLNHNTMIKSYQMGQPQPLLTHKNFKNNKHISLKMEDDKAQEELKNSLIHEEEKNEDFNDENFLLNYQSPSKNLELQQSIFFDPIENSQPPKNLSSESKSRSQNQSLNTNNLQQDNQSNPSLNKVKSVQSFINDIENDPNLIMESVQSYLFQTCFNNDKKKNQCNVFESLDGEYKYKLGIIDFLTEYNAAKKIENTWNNMIHWKDRQDISCQEPEIYADRFLEFMRENL